MELEVVKRGIDFARKRKKWVVVLAALSFTSYGAYRVYHLPSVARKRRRILKLLGALVSVAEAMSDSSELIGVVSRDLKEFLQSDADQIPNSLRQISKLARSDEFSSSLTRFTQALTLGILQGYQTEKKDESSNSSSFTDQVMDKLFTTAGSGFASVVVGSFARNLVMAFYSGDQSSGQPNTSSNTNHFDSEKNPIPKWMNVVCSDKGRELIGDCIQLFVSTAVAVYLDKTMQVNTYDEILSGLTDPKHETKVRDILVSVSNGAVETLVRTSHQVLTAPTVKDNTSNTNPSFCLATEKGANDTKTEDLEQEDLCLGYDSASSCDDEGDGNGGWISKVSSTLAVPGNRRFVLEITGRVTFETVRSFLAFLLEKLYEGVRGCANSFHESVVERGLDIVRYAAAKSSVLATICLSLCLHMTSGAWMLEVPA
ncbi:hypothetical protein UlMin_038997 [Ulmus minor]